MHSLDDPALTTVPTQTAVTVPVPAADAVVGMHRLHMDRAAAWGVPAHVTVLYPFLPPDEVDESALAELSAAMASVPPFDCTFANTGWFGTQVLWLAPQPSEPLRQLTIAVCSAFPDYPPYEGQYDGITPHLTVAERALGGPGALEAAEAAVRAELPVTQHIAHALLIAGSQQPGSWRTLHRLPLGMAHGHRS